VKIAAGSEMKLKSLHLDGDVLAVTLWGRPAALALGPTPDLVQSQLPSWLIWMYTHQLGALAFSLLGWVIVTTLASLRLFGRIE